MRGSMLSTLAVIAIGSLVATSALAQPRIQQPPPSQPGGPPPGGPAPGGPTPGGQPPQQPQRQAPAQQPTGGLMTGTNPQITMQVLRAAGFTDVEQMTGEQANYVKAKINGNTVYFSHLGCKDGMCPLGTFFTVFGQQANVDLNWINAWNVSQGFGKLSQTKDGAIVLQMGVHFIGGTTPEHFKSSAQVFAHFLQMLIDFKPGQN